MTNADATRGISVFLRQFARFSVVGLSAAAIYFLITSLLHQHAGLSVPVAGSTAFVLVAAMTYVLHHGWTFRSGRSHLAALPRFIGGALGAMAINYFAVSYGARSLLLSQTEALILGAGLVIGWNFLLSRFWIFLDSSA